MRLVFMGTPSFAVPSLEAVAASHEVAAAYTRPDAVSGRGSSLVASPVKSAALRLGIEVRQPVGLGDSDSLAQLQSFAADAIVVVAYGVILPAVAISSSRHGAINVHASLLPRWRGAAPIQRAILAGDDVTGVSIMRIGEGLDTGPTCLRVETPVGEKYADELATELAESGARALVESLGLIEACACEWTAQSEEGVTYAKKIEKGEIVWSPQLTAEDALRRLRASSEQAPTRLSICGKGMRAVRAERFSAGLEMGSAAIAEQGVALGFSEGALLLTELKPDGKQAMRASDWARGQSIDATSTWGGPL